MKKSNRISFYFLLPSFILITVVFFYPFIYAIYISFFRYNLINLRFPKTFIFLDNFVRAFLDPTFWNSFFVTMKFVCIAVPIELILGMLLASILQRNFKGMRFIRTIFLIPMMVTPVVVGLLWRFMLNPEVGIINSLLNKDISWLGNQTLAFSICVFIDVWQWTPFMFIIIFAGMRSLSIEPYEAAIVDGASKTQIFWYITLPLMKKILLIAITLRTLEALKIFDTIYILTKGGPVGTTDTLSIMLYRTGLRFFHIGYSGAISLIFLIVVLVLAITLLRLVNFKIGED
jgi:multiple sugar transport system permease protein